MNRFFLPPEACQGEHLELTGAEGHHAAQVLRVRPGETVCLLDGAGTRCLCEVAGISRHTVQLRVLQRESQPAPTPPITLFQAIPKGKAMDWVVQKATELGLHRLVPVLAERSVVQVDDASALQKTGKWTTTAIEAAKQCGSAWLPRIDPPLPLPSALQALPPADLTLVASLHEGARHPRQVFEQFRSLHGRMPRSVAAWVGPEGDFTPAELDLLLSAGAQPINLGPLVLRSETAALCCLAIIQHEARPA